MKKIKYFFQFLLIIFIFFLFKILGFKISSYLGGKLFEIMGPYFRSNKITFSNLKRAFPNKNDKELKIISKAMWNNYSRVFEIYFSKKI